MGSGCICSCLLVACLTCVATLGPNTYGLIKNSLTGSVELNAYRGGFHFVGPLKNFIEFPATAVTVEFSNRLGSNGQAISSRTGKDQDTDAEAALSGGQPVFISAAFQYKFLQDHVSDAYLTFGSVDLCQERVEYFGRNVISNYAQNFTSSSFWEDRKYYSDTILKVLSEILWVEAWVVVTMFEILSVDFTPQYEHSLVNKQLKEQQSVLNDRLQDVQRVVNDINVMYSETTARINNVSAAGEATAKKIRAHAQQDAFILTQYTKAHKYRELFETLDFSNADMQKYFKIKALMLQGHSSEANSNIVVGMQSPGESVGPAVPRSAVPRFDL